MVHVSEMIEADVIWQRRPFTFPLFPALFIIDVREVSSEKICSGFKSSLASKYSTCTIHILLPFFGVWAKNHTVIDAYICLIVGHYF